MWNRFATALSFLTVLRLPYLGNPTITSEAMAKSYSLFPLAGLLLGGIAAATAALLSGFMDPLLLACFLAIELTLLTRGLHLDGLADLADGVGGGYTRERRLEIMKDSRTGAFGAIAIALALLTKIAALQALIVKGLWGALAVVPVLSRYGMVLISFRSTYARAEGGLGKHFLDHITRYEVLHASLLALIILLVLTPVRALPLSLLLGGVVVAMRRLSSRWLGGVTGDVLGASNEIAEILLLSLASSL